MLKNNKLFITAILLCFSLITVAQNTNSPYSRYGYGVLTDNGVGISKSMGGISYGLKRSSNINPGNPASYSKIDSLTFLFDIGLHVSSAKLNDGNTSDYKNNGGLDYVTMMLRLKKGLGLSFGIMPYSSVGYSMGTTSTLNGISYQTSHSGSGGLSQVYGGLAYEPIKGLSIGANISYLFGNLEHTRSIPLTTEDAMYTSQERSTMSVNGIKPDFGIQYELPVSFDKTLTLGAVYSPKMDIKGDFERYNTQYSSSSIVSADTLLLENRNVGIPATYGFGFTLANRTNWLIGADVTYQEWKKIKYENDFNDNLSADDRFNNRLKVSVGGEYVVNPLDRSYAKRIKYRGGLNYSNSYMNIKNAEGKLGGYNEYGATLGVALPFRDMNFTGRTSYINVNLEYKLLNPDISNMVKEQYFGVSVSVNINDLWFVKSKFR